MTFDRVGAVVARVSGLTVEVRFLPGSRDLGLVQSEGTPVLAGFEVDLSQEKIQQVFQAILQQDGTAERKFSRDGFLKWKIDLSNYPAIRNRYQCLLPMVCKSERLGDALYPFQQLGKSWLLRDSARILADDMGLGKTIQAIAAIEEGLFLSKFSSVLIVCPKTIVSVWVQELSKWCPMLKVSVLKSEDIRSRLTLRGKILSSNVVIGTYPSLPQLAESLRDQAIQFDLIVADEAHRLRNRTSDTNQFFRSLNRANTWLLTGTPLERDEEDIPNILECLAPDSPGAADRAVDSVIHKSRLRASSLRRTKVEVLEELPAVERVVHWLDLGEAQRRAYRQGLRDMQKRPQQERIGSLTTLFALAIADGSGNSTKIDKALSLCQSAVKSGKKIIIFSNFNDVLSECSKKLNFNNITAGLLTGEADEASRRRLVSEFRQDERLSCLLCNSKIGSEGLTLTEASVVIFLNEWWNPSSNRQAEDRVNRIGQRDKVVIHLLRSRSTIDENLSEILERKKGLEKDILQKLEQQIMEIDP